MGPAALALLIIGVVSAEGAQGGGGYYGKEVGALSRLQHGVSGEVYAVDSRTLFLKDFHYDGEGPAAYFYVGKSKTPRAEGSVRLRDERGGAGPLRRYRGEGVTLSLPDSLSLKEVRWFSVWCDQFAVNFGDVSIPRDLAYPRPAKVAPLRGVHSVSSDPIVVVDAQTLLVPNFSYDGEAPDAKFWVGRGNAPSPQGIRIPDENGKETPLGKYDSKTIVLTLPGELTVFDIGHFGVWCEAFTVDFGHITLPRSQLENVPPSLRMLGVSPQSRNKALAAGKDSSTPSTPRKPIVRLDATTYRPHLRPGTAPLQAVAGEQADRSTLYRRANNYSSATGQIIPDDSKSRETHRTEQQYYQQRLSQEQTQRGYEHQQQEISRGAQLPQEYFQQSGQIPAQQYLLQLQEYQTQAFPLPQQIYYQQGPSELQQLRYEQALLQAQTQVQVAGRNQFGRDLDPVVG